MQPPGSPKTSHIRRHIVVHDSHHPFPRINRPNPLLQILNIIRMSIPPPDRFGLRPQETHLQFLRQTTQADPVIVTLRMEIQNPAAIYLLGP